MIESNGGVKCELCATKTFHNPPKQHGWDWFTGLLTRTHHYCPVHADSGMRDAAFRKAKGTLAADDRVVKEGGG